VARKTPDDIEPAALDMDLPELQALPRWLSSYYTSVEQATIQAIRWYLRKKKSKSRWSRFFRASSIVLGAMGALLPLLSPITNVSLAWGYTALALAGACVALDKLFGFSSSWMRYMQSEFELQHLLSQLQASWLLRACTGSRDTQTANHSEADLAQMLAEHSDAVASLIRAETAAWAREFNGALSAKLEPVMPAQDLPKGQPMSPPAIM
jgi:nucleoside permease NupC